MLDPQAAGYLVRIDGPLPGSVDAVDFRYDAFGRASVRTGANGLSTTTSYDALNRIVRVDYSDGTHEQTLYDRLDPEWQRSRDGLWTYTLFDSMRRPVLVQNSSFDINAYSWCLCGSLASVTDPAGRVTRWSYDAQGRLAGRRLPDGSNVDYDYEPLSGRLSKRTDAKGQVTRYVYNVDDSVREIRYEDESGQLLPFAQNSVTYTYEAAYGRVESVTDSLGTISFEYVQGGSLGAGRLHMRDGPLANDEVLFQYDEVGSVTRQVVGSDVAALWEIENQFDVLGRLVGIASPIGSVQLTYEGVEESPSLVAHATSHEVEIDRSEVAGMPVVLEIVNRLNAAGPSVVSSDSYSFYSNGLIREWEQVRGVSPANLQFSYDDQKRLLAVDTGDGGSGVLTRQERFRVDRSGNLVTVQVDDEVVTHVPARDNSLSMSEGGGAMSFEGTLDEPGSVTLAGNQVVVQSDLTWEGEAVVKPGLNLIPLVATDAAGNTSTHHINVVVPSSELLLYSYDANGNLTRWGDMELEWDPMDRLVRVSKPGCEVEFEYNALGERIGQKLDGQTVKQWIWAGGLQPVEERDGAGVTLKRFVPFGEQTRMDSASSFASYYYTYDHLGSVREVLDSTGSVRAQYMYGPFGETERIAGDLEAGFGFQGFFRESYCELYFARYRTYAPSLRRWLNRDPYEEVGGLNLYAFNYGDPVNYRDPDGQLPFVTNVLAGVGNVAIGFGLAYATDSCYTWKDAGIDFVGGALGLGTVKNARKALKLVKEYRRIQGLYGAPVRGVGQRVRGLGGPGVAPDVMTNGAAAAAKATAGLGLGQFHDSPGRLAMAGDIAQNLLGNGDDCGENRADPEKDCK